ncbi:Glycosyltransferase, GT2 family [Chitinophaga sp. CF118]|uniref:glycosyltransferase family 2 protein n=1 Tax=Chitinophaga sp. CF118 TaxID=1884367 RepID=UPI0008EF0FF6|nr:glycosyltransferase [Chitinophaga sp. CF118]SFE51098.1 Glycosyltransferase, GT2 family [Chitinophaga sp. CF118]
MRKFSPYTIEHLQLNQLDELVTPKGNTYLVFWAGELPVGHLWYKASDTHANKQNIRTRINQALRPVLTHYLPASSGTPEWELMLDEGKYSSISSLLNFERTTPPQQTISVVICTRNRPTAMQNCLTSLTKCLDNDFEIVVVDNAPDNNLTELVVAKFPGVKYVLEKRKGLDIARNTGARYATHNIIAYTDDDVIIPSNWIQNVKSCFDNPLTMAVTGIVLPAELETYSQYVFEHDWSFNKGYLPRVFDHRYFLDHVETGVPAWDIGAGANMAFRKEAFELVGLFDERLDVGASGCSGDSEMWYRILAEGWNCNYYPHLYVYHQHRRTMKELRSQLYHYMRGHVSALLVQHENYQHKGNLDRIYKGFPKYYYYRIKGYFSSNRDNSALLSEIKGCFAGMKYYKANKDRKRHDIYSLPEKLMEKAVVNEDTKVSVIIPCYNHSHFLKQAIDSVLGQTHQNLEIIVIDDGSDDETASICYGYGEWVKYVRVERVGLSAARNIGVQFSTGDFIVFLDADDFLYESAFEINLYYFNFYGNVAFVSGGHKRMDYLGLSLPTISSEVKSGDNYWSLLQGNYIGMEGTIMYRRELFFHFHFDTSLQSCEDYDLNLRIARIFPVFSHSDLIAVYRIHSGNMSLNKKTMKHSALTVLKTQENLLINEEEKSAHKIGMENWEKFYGITT